MITGVATIAGCMFAGFFAGDIIGQVIGVGSNVGGVGFAMFLLLIVTDKLKQKGKLTQNISILAVHVYSDCNSNDSNAKCCCCCQFRDLGYSCRCCSRTGGVYNCLAFKLLAG